MKLYVFTTETQRSRREEFLSVGEVPDRQKASVSNKLPLPKAREFMENRYLPILHENTLLSVLGVSNEPHLSGASGW